MNAMGIDDSDLSSLRRHAWIGIASVIVVLGGLGAWAALTEIDGAVVTSGNIVVESYAKSVQHQDGGTIKEILVRNEDVVDAGQVLIRFDDTTAAASFAMVDGQYRQALAEEARLLAEIEGKANFAVPAELSEANDTVPLATQRKILAAQLAGRDGRVAQLREQVTQLEKQIEGLEIQRQASETQISILDRESKELASLLTQQLIEASRVNALAKDMAAEQGNRGRLVAAIAETRATIAERRLQMVQIENDSVSDALDQLQKVRQSIADLRPQRLAAGEKLSRTTVRAPQGGVVHESIVHTVGGVVAPGEVIMQIVPQNDVLLVSVRVDPMDVDQLAVGQKTIIRLSSFDQRSTPEVNGAIEAISPDYVQDRATGREYYTAQVDIDAGELARLPRTVRLRPGMPVQALVTTGSRTVLSYLIHPFVEEMNLALREE